MTKPRLWTAFHSTWNLATATPILTIFSKTQTSTGRNLYLLCSMTWAYLSFRHFLNFVFTLLGNFSMQLMRRKLFPRLSINFKIWLQVIILNLEVIYWRVKWNAVSILPPYFVNLEDQSDVFVCNLNISFCKSFTILL